MKKDPEIQSEIQSLITDVIKRKFGFDCTLTRMGGHSGNSVYLVAEDEDPVYVVKVFHSERICGREVDSYKFLEDHGFSCAKVAFTEHIDDWHMMFMYVVEGSAPKAIVKQNIKDLDFLYRLGREMGKTLRKLHELGRHKILKTLTPEQLKHAVLVQMDDYVKIDEKLIDRFVEDPGCFSYVHGDATIRNFIVKDDTILIVIDAGGYRGKITQAIPRNKRDSDVAYGLPARDYWRFMCRTRAKFGRKGKDKENMAGSSIEDGFNEAYGDRFEMFTPAAEELFKTYWCAKKGIKW